jgi:hypothetical protein
MLSFVAMVVVPAVAIVALLLCCQHSTSAKVDFHDRASNETKNNPRAVFIFYWHGEYGRVQ